MFNSGMRSLIILEINMFLNVYIYIIKQVYQIIQIYTLLCRIGFQNDLWCFKGHLGYRGAIVVIATGIKFILDFVWTISAFSTIVRNILNSL